MNYPYPRFFLDVELAKKRLSQVWAPAREAAHDSVPPPAARSAPARNEQRKPPTYQRTTQEVTQSCNAHRHLTGNQGSPTRSERSSDDMTPFCFNLTLVLIGTIAAAHTDNPVFWLLAGPRPVSRRIYGNRVLPAGIWLARTTPNLWRIRPPQAR